MNDIADLRQLCGPAPEGTAAKVVAMLDRLERAETWITQLECECDPLNAVECGRCFFLADLRRRVP